MTMHLKQTFEAVILTEKYPKSQIDIYVEVKLSKSQNDYQVIFFSF
jgi:ribonuclease PH